MLKTLGSHLRGNVVGYVAVSGTTYAATRGTTGQGEKHRVGLSNRTRQASSDGIPRLLCAAAVAALGALLWLASPASAAVVVHPTLVKTIATSAYTQPSPDPSGIVYRPGLDRFLIADSEVDETPLYQGFNLFTGTRTGPGFGSGTLLARGSLPATSKEPTDLGFNPGTGTLYVSDDDKDRVSVVRGGPDGKHGTADDIVSKLSTAAFGNTDPEGVVYDPATGHLFITSGAGIEVYNVNPVNGIFGDGNDTVTHFDVARYGAGDAEGLGIDPSRNALLVVDPATHAIYEVGKGGALLRTLSLSAIPTTHSVVADVTMAPTSDPNDSPSVLDYWIVDRHFDNNPVPNENDGLLYEMR
jgi:DNA-binding beta-propeller fold protein YncE